MKTFSNLNENCSTMDINPGNGLDLGVTNHLTPLNNIVTNVRNLFATRLGIIVVPAEDGVSLKMHSNFFVNKEEVDKVLNNQIYYNLSVADYIRQQGLDFIKMINLGQYWVVYFCPRDIVQAVPTIAAADAQDVAPCEDPMALPCEEQLNLDIDQAEMDTIVKEGSDDDEEMQDVTKAKLQEIISGKDKVKGAKQLELMVGQEMELPREYYFAGVKAKNGDESIALRWKYTKRAGHNETTEMIKSLINIYDMTEDGVFVPDFDEKSMFKLPEEVETLIKNILDFIGAKETKDPCVYSLADLKEDDKKDDKKDDKSDDSEDKSKDSSNEDNKSKESNDSKSEDTDADDLLG